jgi:GT2 family glycosyltransferase
MELSIIFVNWNSLAYLRDCIASVYQHTSGIVFEIIVVDNASPEGGVEVISEQFPEVVLIKSGENLGFAGANNLGFRRATGEYVLFLNPDTKLIHDSINVLLRHIRSLPDAGIVGCKLLNSDLSIQISSIKRFPTILNQMLEAEYLQLHWPNCPLWSLGPLFADKVTVLPVDVIPGACMLLRHQVFEQVGLFSEDYFMYAEDLDLNVKVKRAGFTNYYVGETAIIHHGGGSSSRQKVNHWATVMQCRAMVRYFHKTRGRSYQRLYQVSVGCAAIARLAVLAGMSLFGNRLSNAQARRNSWDKWTTVLKWAVGKRDLAMQGRS